MSESYEPTRSGNLTTEQLANAGETNPGAAEPRTFEDGAPVATDTSAQPLVSAEEADDLRRAWDSIQAGFVDEPRRAVEDADHLVAQAMKRLAEMFADERRGLEAQWDRGDDVSTEDLRIALQRYRTFFDRLLAA